MPAAIRTKLRLLGYSPGAPRPTDLDGPAIDSALCEEMVCPQCGQEGMSYFPYVAPASYRAVAVCPRCRHEEEI